MSRYCGQWACMTPLRSGRSGDVEGQPHARGCRPRPTPLARPRRAPPRLGDPRHGSPPAAANRAGVATIRVLAEPAPTLRSGTGAAYPVAWVQIMVDRACAVFFPELTP